MSLRNKTIAEALREGKQRLRSAGKDAYAVEAELLLEKAVGLNRTALFLRGEEPLSAEAAMQYEGFLAERESGRPTQYILGTWEFMGLPFSVGEGVLIPRGDTEILVETILEKQQTEPLRTILDIGTGSGCIPVSLSHYGQFEYVLAVDISRKALGYATKNAAANHAEISFYESDLFQNIPAQWRGQLDAIVSNPPYIPKEDIAGLMTEVKDFEPRNALDGGADGLDFYRSISEKWKDALVPGGRLYFEVGIGQADSVLRIMRSQGFGDIQIVKDLHDIPRVVFGTLCTEV